MGFVIVLSVFLIATIATLANSIDRTILTIYGYTNYFSYVIPQRVTNRVPADQLAIIHADPRVDRVMEASLFFTNIKTVIGSLPFVVLGLDGENRKYILNKVGTEIKEGRMPAEGMPEAAVSEPLAKNKKVKIGDVISGPHRRRGDFRLPRSRALCWDTQRPGLDCHHHQKFLRYDVFSLPALLYLHGKDPQ